MQVVLDISPLAAASTTGIGRLIIGIAQALLNRPDLDVNFFAVSPRQRLPYLSHRFGKGKIIPVPARFLSSGLSIFQKLNFPLEVFFPKADLTINVDWLCLPLLRGKTVSIVADMTPITNPLWYTDEEIHWFKRRIRAVESNSDKVIALSRDVKKDCTRYLEKLANKCVFCYPGIDEIFKKSFDGCNTKKLLKKYCLNKPFLFMVGAKGQRKNLDTVLSAFSRFDLAGEYDLVIAGQIDNLLHPNLPNYVKLLGRLSDANLACLYSAARALIYPSLKEGFGFPILEANYIGTPVITSNCSSLKEIGKGIAVLVNPRDPKSLAQAIKNLPVLKSSKTHSKKLITELDKKYSYKKMVDVILSD